MTHRCYNKNSGKYKDYGGRGIIVAAEWLGEGGFEKFLSHVGLRPTPKHSIDRIKNDGNYEPGNVKWSTDKEQARNRRSSRFVVWNGETKTLVEWAEVLGFRDRVLRDRLFRYGWSIDKAFTTLVRKVDG
jgi:hypothetical protein